MEKHLGRNGIHLRAKTESGSGPKLGATTTNQKAALGDSCPLRGGPTSSFRPGNGITTPDVNVAWSVMRLLQLQACLLLLVIGEPCRGPAADAAKAKAASGLQDSTAADQKKAISLFQALCCAPAEGAGDACATNAWPAGQENLRPDGWRSGRRSMPRTAKRLSAAEFREIPKGPDCKLVVVEVTGKEGAGDLGPDEPAEPSADDAEESSSVHASAKPAEEYRQMAGNEPTLIAGTAAQSDDHVTNAAHWCAQEQVDAALADWADETAEAPPISAVILVKEFPTQDQMSTVTGLGGV